MILETIIINGVKLLIIDIITSFAIRFVDRIIPKDRKIFKSRWNNIAFFIRAVVAGAFGRSQGWSKIIYRSSVAAAVLLYSLSIGLYKCYCTLWGDRSKRPGPKWGPGRGPLRKLQIAVNAYNKIIDDHIDYDKKENCRMPKLLDNLTKASIEIAKKQAAKAYRQAALKFHPDKFKETTVTIPDDVKLDPVRKEEFLMKVKSERTSVFRMLNEAFENVQAEIEKLVVSP